MNDHASLKRSHDEAIGDDHIDADQGDSLFVEDDTDRVPPYDAKKEGLPVCKLYTAAFKVVEDGKIKISRLLEAPFQETTFRSGPTDGLLEDHRRRIKDRSSDKIKVGKSSVINSLLSVGVIARQGDAGSSCTWVVNEFSDLLPNQAQSFAAEIYFFTQPERHDIIQALVADYYRASPKDHNAKDGSKDPDQASEDLSTMQGVVTAFRALFIASPEFYTVEKAHEFLSHAGSEDDAEIIDYLCALSDRLMARVLRGNCIRYEADTPQSLLLDIEPFQHTVEEHEGEPMESLWPFVSHIKFGLDCGLLKHVTLVDLPGLSDANKTRVANATAHLRTCTYSMVVAHIGRATDDKFIRQHLSRGYTSRGSGRAILVLTRADAMDEASEVAMTRKGQQKLDELRSQAEDLEKRKLDMTHKIKKLAKGVQKYEATEARDEIAKKIRQIAAQYQEVRIQARSFNVSKQMESLYRDLTPDPLRLAVFCVGNAAYKKHQVGYSCDDPNPPTLSVQATAIPALRQHLFRAPMDGRLNETRNQVLTQIPAILGSCELYASKTHMARKDEIQCMVLDPQYYIHSSIDSAFDTLKAEVDRAILALFRQDELTWTAEAQKLCSAWALHESTVAHLGVLKKDGVRKGTKKTKAANWNAELIAINSGEIRQWFSDFIPAFDTAQKVIVKEVNSMATKMSNDIRSDPQVVLMALKPFIDYIWVEKGTINERAQKPMRQLRRDFGNIFRCATSDEVDNPVVRAMRPVYEEARKIKNQRGVRGSTFKKRLGFFNGVITRHGDGVWMAAHDHLKSDICSVLDNYAEQFKDAMMKFFVGIEKKFNLMCAENGKEDEREVELRSNLSKNTAEARDFYAMELMPAARKFFAS